MKTLVAICDAELKKLLFPPALVQKLESLSEVVWAPEGVPYTGAGLARDIAGVDACITGWGSPKFTPEVLAHADQLRFIGHTAGTVIPVVDACVFARGVTVVNANTCLAHSTAELAFTLMLAGAWRLQPYAQRMKDGGWSANSRETVPGVGGQSVGLVGYGEIAREVIRLLRPLGAEIRLFSKHCPPGEAEALGVRLTGLDELLSRSRIVSLHNTLTPESAGMLGARELALLPDGALLVNTARAPIVREAALLHELESGRIWAALDVYEQEPLPRDHPFLRLPNVFCTPHIGGYAAGWKTKLGETVVGDLFRFCGGEPLHGRVSAEKFKSMTPA